jgi:hypothetical protein
MQRAASPVTSERETDGYFHWAAIALLYAVTLAAHTDMFAFSTPQRVFYVLRGFEGLALFMLLPYFVGRALSIPQQVALVIVVVYGGTQEALTALCGTAYYFGAYDRQALDGQLCEVAMGWEWLPYALALIAGAWAWRANCTR